MSQKQEESMNKITLLAALALSIFGQQIAGAATKWEHDQAHSAIYFTIDHIFSKVRGHFNEFTTDIRFDPDDLTASSFFFEIQTRSIDTNIVKRDKHLQSSDFFDSGKYPKMVFQSTRIVRSDDNLFIVSGKLEIKGREHSVKLPLVLAGIAEHPMAKGKTVAGFNGILLLDRLQFGIGEGKFYEIGVVGKDVEVLVTMELLAGS
jgi:polyisoprenoid-binding protein YceI